MNESAGSLPVQARRAFVGLAALVWLALESAACERSEPAPRAREDALVVFAASSLRDAFTAMGSEFERAHPRVEVTFNFAGTQVLRTQLEHGAAADVFASADRRHMDELETGERVGAPVVFAHNEPVLVVPQDNAAAPRTFAELPSADRIVVGTSEVPIGRYTQRMLERATAKFGADFRSRVEANVVSRELNVRQVLAKVSLGEADAGIVYRSDARVAQDRVHVASIPSDINVVAEYPIAVVTGAAHPRLARAWVDFVTSKTGQRLLRNAGFTLP